MGRLLTSAGLKPDHARVEAINMMAKPEDGEGVQLLNGFVNYLPSFLPKLSDVMGPIRRLTHEKVQWQWTREQDRAFEEVQRLVTKAPVLGYYDLSIAMHASQSGPGAALCGMEDQLSAQAGP